MLVMASRKHSTRTPDYRPDEAETGEPCRRQPPELCEGARLVTLSDGTTRREPARTPRAFCHPCESRITTVLSELPAAYERLEAAIASPVRRTAPVRVTPGSRVLVGTEEFDLMSTMSAVLGGWAARVRHVPGLQLTDPGHAPGSPEAIEDACVRVLARYPAALLSLQDGWAFRMFTYIPASSGPQVSACRRCGQRIIAAPDRETWRLAAGGPSRPGTPPPRRAVPRQCEHEPDSFPVADDVIPAHLLDLIGDREIIRQGDGWVTVLDELDGGEAGNEILDLHWRARKILGETKAQPESLDGIPCRNCEAMGLERAEPPSDPSLEANHSRCPECGDEMDEDTFAEWADTYLTWARGAGIRECRRCALAAQAATEEESARLHAECCWDRCQCRDGSHPRRRAAA